MSQLLRSLVLMDILRDARSRGQDDGEVIAAVELSKLRLSPEDKAIVTRLSWRSSPHLYAERVQFGDACGAYIVMLDELREKRRSLAWTALRERPYIEKLDSYLKRMNQDDRALTQWIIDLSWPDLYDAALAPDEEP